MTNWEKELEQLKMRVKKGELAGCVVYHESAETFFRETLKTLFQEIRDIIGEADKNQNVSEYYSGRNSKRTEILTHLSALEKYWGIKYEEEEIKIAQEKAKKLGHCLCNKTTKCPCTLFIEKGICPCSNGI